MVGQHPRHVQIFDDEPVVGLDQRVADLVQEMPPGVGNVMVVTPQLGCGVATSTIDGYVTAQRATGAAAKAGVTVDVVSTPKAAAEPTVPIPSAGTV